MSIDRAYRVATITVLAIMAAAVVNAGCAFLKSIGRTAAVAGGGAGGAVVGIPAGPIGMAAGAAAGAGAIYAVQENSELREGSLQGDGARDEETDRLKSLLMLSQGELQVKERAIAEIQERTSWLRKWVLWLLVAGLITRNLHNFKPFARALAGRRWLLALWWFAHMLLLPWRPKE